MLGFFLGPRPFPSLPKAKTPQLSQRMMLTASMIARVARFAEVARPLAAGLRVDGYRQILYEGGPVQRNRFDL